MAATATRGATHTLTDQDQRMISYIRRHNAQQPDGNITNTRWRYSLMNWGRDLLR